MALQATQTLYALHAKQVHGTFSPCSSSGLDYCRNLNFWQVVPQKTSSEI